MTSPAPGTTTLLIGNSTRHLGSGHILACASLFSFRVALSTSPYKHAVCRWFLQTVAELSWYHTRFGGCLTHCCNTDLTSYVPCARAFLGLFTGSTSLPSRTVGSKRQRLRFSQFVLCHSMCSLAIIRLCSVVFTAIAIWTLFSVLINYLDSSFIARSICSNLCSFCTQGEFENGFCNIRFFVIGFRFSSRDLVIVLWALYFN